MLHILKRIFSGENKIARDLPEIVFNVKGFESTLSKTQEGYELVLRSDGRNADYPLGEEVVLTFKRAEHDNVSGYRDRTIHLPQSLDFTLIEVIERPYIKPGKDIGEFYGRVPSIPYPPHHSLSVNAIGWIGRTQMVFSGPNLIVRKSEKETPQWQAAANSPHYNLAVV